MPRIVTFEAEVVERTLCRFSLSVPDSVVDVDRYARSSCGLASNDEELEYCDANIDVDTIANIQQSESGDA